MEDFFSIAIIHSRSSTNSTILICFFSSSIVTTSKAAFRFRLAIRFGFAFSYLNHIVIPLKIKQVRGVYIENGSKKFQLPVWAKKYAPDFLLGQGPVGARPNGREAKK